MAEPAEDQLLHDLVVVGGGIAALVAALEAAKLGVQVVLVAPQDELGGSIRTVEFAGVSGVEMGAEQFTEGDAVDVLCAELEVPTETLSIRHTLLSTDRVTAEIPADSIAGIPGNPFSPALRPFIGAARWRAYADRVMPFLKIGTAQNLGELVRRRLGTAVADNFTDPYARAVYGCAATELAVERVVPGLNSTMTSLGSLSGAALARSNAPLAARRVVGGLDRLVLALRDRLENYLVQFVDARATLVEQSGEHWLIGTVDQRAVRAHAVIVACDPADVGLSRPALDEPVQQLKVVALELTLPEEARSNATGVIYADGGVRGASRSSIRSSELSDRIGAHRELLRLTVRDEITQSELGTGVRRVLSDLGLPTAEVGEQLQQSWSVMRQWVRIADPQPNEQMGSQDGSLEFAGQWAAGPGLSAAVSNAGEVAHRVRRVALNRRLAANA